MGSHAEEEEADPKKQEFDSRFSHGYLYHLCQGPCFSWASSSRDMDCGVLCSIDDIDLDSLLNSHTSSREGHLTGEVGSMVLEPGSEGQH